MRRNRHLDVAEQDFWRWVSQMQAKEAIALLMGDHTLDSISWSPSQQSLEEIMAMIEQYAEDCGMGVADIKQHKEIERAIQSFAFASWPGRPHSQQEP